MAKNPRASGVLMHITSLPSAFGIGDLGPESYRFVDLLASLGQRYWSILPLSPTRLEDGNSPYQTNSAYAGNLLLISREKLVEAELLPKEYLQSATERKNKVDYPKVYAQHEIMLGKAYANFKKKRVQRFNSAFTYEDFCSENENWLNDYALYSALRKKTGKPWHLWPTSLRKRHPEALARLEQELKGAIEQEKFGQYILFSQWSTLKKYCNTKRISVVGDMPFYVAYDSVDVWVHPELFKLTGSGKPRFAGGVPPDYFSATGQLWGNPVYNWKKHEQTGFGWWTDRISHNLRLYDKLRLDHFRGFVAYWQVAASEKTAQNGRWIKTPSDPFFKSLRSAFPSLPFIAEDLGMIDEPVREAIKRLGVPSMKVLLFAFDGDKDNPHLPRNHTENSVVYTGTHDTNTARGWYATEAGAKEKRNLYREIGKRVPEKEVSLELAKLALESVACLSIIPLQDVLSLGADARMNDPSNPQANWTWRVLPKQLESKNLDLMANMTREFSRVS